jgi:hypothetical protein
MLWSERNEKCAENNGNGPVEHLRGENVGKLTPYNHTPKSLLCENSEPQKGAFQFWGNLSNGALAE